MFVWLMNTLFNKVLGENEKGLLFLLKTKRTFWPTQYLMSSSVKHSVRGTKGFMRKDKAW